MALASSNKCEGKHHLQFLLKLIIGLSFVKFHCN